MYGDTYSKSKDQPGKVANPARGQLNRAESGAYLQDSSRVPRRRPYIYLNRHTPSGQSQVCRVTQLCTDGVHSRESAGTGPVNLQVVPNECCLSRSPWTNLYTPLFPTPTIATDRLGAGGTRGAEEKAGSATVPRGRGGRKGRLF